jgi:hypothetical protein
MVQGRRRGLNRVRHLVVDGRHLDRNRDMEGPPPAAERRRNAVVRALDERLGLLGPRLVPGYVNSGIASTASVGAVVQGPTDGGLENGEEASMSLIALAAVQVRRMPGTLQASNAASPFGVRGVARRKKKTMVRESGGGAATLILCCCSVCMWKRQGRRSRILK